MLLMKHIADPDLVDRLPGIIGLWRDLVSEQSALASLAETLLAWGERIVAAQSLGEVLDERP